MNQENLESKFRWRGVVRSDKETVERMECPGCGGHDLTAAAYENDVNSYILMAFCKVCEYSGRVLNGECVNA